MPSPLGKRVLGPEATPSEQFRGGTTETCDMLPGGGHLAEAATEFTSPWCKAKMQSPGSKLLIQSGRTAAQMQALLSADSCRLYGLCTHKAGSAVGQP